jgi:nitrogen fixation protein NifZ
MPGREFEWGQRVKAAIDIADDGTHPAAKPGEPLVCAGTRGEIVRVGRHVEADVPVYLVDFGGALVVGCLGADLDGD